MPIHAHLQNLRVLVVEDEPRLRDLLSEVLPEMGFQVTAVRSAEEAARLMATDRHDIAILDLQLPLMSGMDFFEQIRRDWPSTQVIVITGFGDLPAARQAIRLDVVDFISKPFHLNEVEVALDRARKRAVQQQRTTVDDNNYDDEEKTPPTTLAGAEQQLILDALHRHGGNRTAAAAELGISRRKLHYWLRNHRSE